jgi:hypothetical protein
LHHRMMLEQDYYYYCQVPTLWVLRGTLLFIVVCIQIYSRQWVIVTNHYIYIEIEGVE